MKRISTLIGRPLWCALLASGAALFAQTAAPAPAPASTDQPLVLNPFTVTSANDYGYREANSVTTSRIAIPLHELPH